MAVEFAISNAPPMPWTIRMTMSSIAPVGPVRSEREGDGGQGEYGEPRVVHPDTAEAGAHTANGHDENGCDDQVAHEHPQQVADVAWF
jgi:hypothetical protein